MLVEPIFEFAIGLSKLQLDETEMALLAAVLLMQSGRKNRKSICFHFNPDIKFLNENKLANYG